MKVALMSVVDGTGGVSQNQINQYDTEEEAIQYMKDSGQPGAFVTYVLLHHHTVTVGTTPFIKVDTTA